MPILITGLFAPSGGAGSFDLYDPADIVAGDEGEVLTTVGGVPVWALPANPTMGIPGFDGVDGIDALPIPGPMGATGPSGSSGMMGPPGLDADAPSEIPFGPIYSDSQAVSAVQSADPITLKSLVMSESARFTAGAEQTISSGAITVPDAVIFPVDTEGDAPFDDLVTINGGTAAQLIVIHPAADTRALCLFHGQGNIRCAGGEDVILLDSHDYAWLQYDGTNWNVVSAPRHSPMRMLDWEDDFAWGTNAAGQLGNLGWLIALGSTAAQASSAAHPGVVRHLAPGYAAYAYVSSLGGAIGPTGTSLWNDTYYFDQTWVVKPNQTTNVKYSYGLGGVANPPNPHVGFGYDSTLSEVNWMAVVNGHAGGSTRTSTGVAFAADWQTLRVRCIAPLYTTATYEFYVGNVYTPQVTISGINWVVQGQYGAIFALLANPTGAAQSHDLDKMRTRFWVPGGIRP